MVLTKTISSSGIVSMNVYAILPLTLSKEHLKYRKQLHVTDLGIALASSVG